MAEKIFINIRKSLPKERDLKKKGDGKRKAQETGN